MTAPLSSSAGICSSSFGATGISLVFLDVHDELGAGGAVVPQAGQQHRGAAAPGGRALDRLAVDPQVPPHPRPQAPGAGARRARTAPGRIRPGRSPARGRGRSSSRPAAAATRACPGARRASADRRGGRRPLGDRVELAVRRPCPRPAAIRAGSPAGSCGPAGSAGRSPCAGTRAAVRPRHRPTGKDLLRAPARPDQRASARAVRLPAPQPAPRVLAGRSAGSCSGSTDSARRGWQELRHYRELRHHCGQHLRDRDTRQRGHGRLGHAGFLCGIG